MADGDIYICDRQDLWRVSPWRDWLILFYLLNSVRTLVVLLGNILRIVDLFGDWLVNWLWVCWVHYWRAWILLILSVW